MDVHLHILNVPSLANNLPLVTNNSLSIHSLAWSAKEKVASVAGKNNYIMKVNKENNWITDKVPTKYVGLIKDMYNNIVTSVRTSDGDTDNFPIRI